MSTKTLDVQRLARELGVKPPPSPLSDQGQEIAAALLDDPAAMIRSSGKGFDLDDSEVIAELLGKKPAQANPMPVKDEPSGHEPSLTPTREALLRLLEWSQGYAWPERTGASDKLTYEAVVRTAFAANTLTVELSRYTVAELAGVSHSTAWRSLRRHVAKGRLMSFPRKDEASSPAVDRDVHGCQAACRR